MGGSRRRYQSYVASDEADDLPEPRPRTPVLVSESSCRQVLEDLEDLRPDPEVSCPDPDRADPDSVVDQVTEVFGVEPSAVLRTSRGRGHRNPARPSQSCSA